MMKKAVEQCGGDDRIAEDLAPFRKATIGGEDHGAALVARVDELEEQVAATLNDWQVADLVNDEERRPAQEPDPLAQLAFAFGLGQNADDVGKACKVDAAAGLHGLDPEGGGEMPQSRWAFSTAAAGSRGTSFGLAETCWLPPTRSFRTSPRRFSEQASHRLRPNGN